LEVSQTTRPRIALDFGPDHVLFPNLANQPILDLLLRRDLWDHVKAADGTELWQAFGYYSGHGKERLITPSLPNRFLAILPANMAEHPQWKEPDVQDRSGAARYAAELENVIRQRLREIGESVSDHCRGKEALGFDAARFSNQIEKLLEVHWQVVPWPEKIEDALDAAAAVPGEDGKHPLDAIRAVTAMLNRMPVEHRDPQCFRNGNVREPDKAGPLAQVSNAWSALYALTSWQLDAIKSTRCFHAWNQGGWLVDRAQNKDSLNGKEELCLVVPTTEEDASKLSQILAGSSHVFKAGDLLGASTLLKRLWHRTWLCREHAFEPTNFAMPITRSIAAHHPFADNVDEETGSEDEGKYFAVLALDGDEIGKWISGIKCPELAGQLSEEARAYFSKHKNEEFLNPGTRRPLSPSFHLQFSEIIANFGIHCVRRIVQAFDGRLIYAGGDDVLAMLPADTAISCARALRTAFRGDKSLPGLAKGIADRSSSKPEDWRSDQQTPLFLVEHEGFVRLTPQAAPQGHGAKAGLLDEPVKFPFLVPGPAADCSVGIAIAHFKSPLQDVVRAAQAAEQRAKKQLGRSAVAVTLFKRSGETIEWGCKWEGGGLDFYRALADALDAEQLSAKFPYRVVELLAAYLTETTPLVRDAKTVQPVPNFPANEIIRREFAHVRLSPHRRPFSRPCETGERTRPACRVRWPAGRPDLRANVVLPTPR
jgi:CRISPR-associated protein Cas10/Cmr2 subtype III-B